MRIPLVQNLENKNRELYTENRREEVEKALQNAKAQYIPRKIRCL